MEIEIKMNYLFIGIDNGLNGAVVVLSNRLKLVNYWDTPTIESKKGKKHQRDFAPQSMCQILNKIRTVYSEKMDLMVFLEMAHALPEQGVSSTFKTGRGFGLWEGICLGLGLRYDIIHARTWTKVMCHDVPLDEPKARSLTKAQRLFPTLPLMKPRGRVLSMDGRSDAALIAYYGGSQLLKGE